VNRVFGNARILLLAEVMNVFSGVAAVVVLARVLDASALGLYSFSFAVGSLVGVACLFGASQLIIREVSRDPVKLIPYAGNSLLARLVLAGVLVLASEILFMATGYSGRRLAVVTALLLARVFECFLLMTCAFFRGLQEMKVEGVLRVSLNGAYLLIGLPVLYLTRSLEVFALLQAFLALGAAVAAQTLLRRRAGASVFRQATVPGAVSFFRESLRFSAVSVCLVLYVQTNTILLAFFRGDHEVGSYTAAFRFISALSMAALSVTGAFFPALAKLNPETQAVEMREAFVRTAKALMLMASFSGAVLFGFASRLIHLMYGDGFEMSVLALRLMAVTPLFAFLNGALGSLMFALNMEKEYLRGLAWSVVFVLVVNALLLPWLGAIGACVTTLLPEIFVLIVQSRALGRRLPGAMPTEFLLKSLLVTLAAPIIAWPVNAFFPRMALLLAVYAAGIFLLKVLSPGDWRWLKGRLSRGKLEAAHA
jgi:O-antigen/teichoic acid export membrane protein